jgi:hypothetical protein
MRRARQGQTLQVSPVFNMKDNRSWLCHPFKELEWMIGYPYQGEDRMFGA